MNAERKPNHKKSNQQKANDANKHTFKRIKPRPKLNESERKGKRDHLNVKQIAIVKKGKRKNTEGSGINKSGGGRRRKRSRKIERKKEKKII